MKLSQLKITAICVIIIGAVIYNEGNAGTNLDEKAATGILVTFFGLCLLVLSFMLSKKKKPARTDDSEMICQDCGSRFKKSWVQIPVCPKCDGTLEPFNPEKE